MMLRLRPDLAQSRSKEGRRRRKISFRMQLNHFFNIPMARLVRHLALAVKCPACPRAEDDQGQGNNDDPVYP
jgi:hypothetical protein